VTALTVPDRPVTPYAQYGGYLGFALIGFLQAVYGPVLIQLQADFAMGPSQAGLTLTAHFSGALAGVLAYHFATFRFTDRALLAASYLLIAAGAVGVMAATGWETLLVCIFLTGLGAGGIDFGLNQIFSLRFGNRAPMVLNILNGMFGLGAVVAPVLVWVTGAPNYTLLFAGSAVVAVILSITVVGIRPAPALARTPLRPAAKLRPSFVLAGFLAVYVFHVAVETGTGSWEPTHLIWQGQSEASAAVFTSLFWGAMMAGRFAIAPISLKYRASSILAISCAALTATILLTAVTPVAPAAYILLGLAIAPIFPTALPWLYRAVPAARGAGAFVIAASMIGGVAFPPLFGSVIDTVGTGWFPLFLALPAAGCLFAALRLRRFADPRLGQDSPGA
jgi:fucose permease